MTHLLIYLANPEVREAIIAVLGSLVTAGSGLFSRYHRAARRHSERKLDLAIADVAFLLAVEERYGELLEKHGLPNSKRTIRAQARTDGYAWSGKFTPGRVAARNSHNGELGVELRRMMARLESAAEPRREAA
ncbi:hypothetical protein [Paraburkholderia sp. J8-2]|uniref:hypothetical protein n=1 Tax=Paraburkholderia sp. J8-2 TaxID=2805440 RepID=UPI002AB5F8B6|nr:hypothetical protein [Paraburkholderia sp. J8-2]